MMQGDLLWLTHEQCFQLELAIWFLLPGMLDVQLNHSSALCHAQNVCFMQREMREEKVNGKQKRQFFIHAHCFP